MHRYTSKTKSSGNEWVTYADLITIGVAIHKQLETATCESEIVRLYQEDTLVRRKMRQHIYDFHQYMSMIGLRVCRSIEEAREYKLSNI